jgi:hypothetical protein
MKQSEVLGHSSVAITKDVYGHLVEGQKRAVAARMSQALQTPNGSRNGSQVPGRIHIHLGSVQVSASSAATGCDSATAIRPIVGTPRATRQRDCPARESKGPRRCPRPRQP